MGLAGKYASRSVRPRTVRRFLYTVRADFRTAMVATVPREKLLIGRRNWTRRTISSSFLCRKLHLFLGKSTKTAATRAALFDSSMHQIVCRLRLCPRPHCGILQRSARPISCILKAYFKRRLVAWHSGRTSVSSRRTFPVLRSTCS